ncbi:MAG: hypothetical protein ACLFUS_14270, partial [Candidatus Sumerlaeia bacterium]
TALSADSADYTDGKAPKARPIIAWGFNPRTDKEKEKRAEGPIHIYSESRKSFCQILQKNQKHHFAGF